MASQKNVVSWEFLLDQRKLQQGLRKSQQGFEDTKRKSSTLKTAMGGLRVAAGALGLAFGAQQILQFGKDSIEAASNYEESLNAMQVVTGVAADSIVALGEDAAEAFGLSKTEVNEAAVAFGGFADKIDRDGDISDTFQDYIARASDFASVMNIEVADALRIFQSTLAGESEPIRRFGLDLSAASVEAHALSEGIIEVGDKMSADDKVLARYSLLMAETANVAGDFANTSEGVANAQKIATAEMENARIELGTRLMPLQKTWIDVQRTMTGALLSGVDAFDDMNKEQELQSRLMFKSLVDAGKLTGHYEDWGVAQGEASDSGKNLSGVWDALIGRTSDLDDALAEVTAETSEATAATDDLTVAELLAQQAYVRYAEGMRDVAAATIDVTDETINLNSVLAEGLNPVSDAIGAYQDFRETLGKIDEDGERTAEELLTLAESVLAVQGKFDALTSENITEAVDAVAFALGISTRKAKELLVELGLLDGKTVNTTVRTHFVQGRSGGTGGIGGFQEFAHGGTLNAGQSALVGEQGPEVITAGKSLRVHPNGSGGGGGTTVNIFVEALDPDAAAVAVADAIRSYEDRFGSIR